MNTSDTRVEVILDLAAAGLPADLHDRLAAKLGTQVRVVAASRRSQLQNRKEALRRLGDRLDKAARQQVKRKPTKPSQRATEARLEEKRRRSAIKGGRRALPEED